MNSRSATTLQFVRLTVLVSLLCILCSNSAAQDFKMLHPGVEYARVEHKIGNDPVKISLLRLDLKKVRLDVHHAFDKAIGVEPTSAIATRHGAIAAINAGFFRLDKSQFAGDIAGIFMIDGKLLSESSNDRISIGILNNGDHTEVLFDQLQTESIVGFGTDSQFTFDGINRERKPNEILLFTPDFHKTTLTDSNGTEIVLTGCQVEEFRCGV